MPNVITTRTLSCGLPLVVEPMPAVRSVALTWRIPAGSATEPLQREGLSTMWSELLFRGSAALDSRAQADALDSLGINRDADTGRFYLALSATLVGDNLLDALPLLVDMVRRPRLDPASIEPTRDLCLQSLDSLADDPHERASIELARRFHPEPLNRSGLGSREGLESITRDDLAAFWSDRVRPVGSILSIAGAVDPDAVASVLDRLLAGWSGSAAHPTWGTSPTRGSIAHVPDESNQVQILLAADAPPEPHPDVHLERLLLAVLSSGASSRLFSEVREKRSLCYSVSASSSADRSFGTLSAYVGTTPERAQDSLDLLTQLLRDVTSSGPASARVTKEEFERAMVGVRSRLVFAGESTAGRASALGSDLHKLGAPRSLDEVRAAYERITLDDLNDYVARRSLDGLTIVTLGPRALTPPAGVREA